MKRVLYLTCLPSPYRIRFFDALSRQTELTVLYSDLPRDHADRDADWYIASQGAYRQVQLKSLRRIGGENLCVDVLTWLKQPFDAIVICGYSSPTFMLAMAWLRCHGIPFYMEVDGGLIRQESRAKYRFKKALVSAARWWLSTGEETTRYLCHYGAKRERVYTYPFTSLEASDILPKVPGREEKLALRRELGLGEEKILLYVGRFDPLKGMDDLLSITPELPESTGVYFIGGEPRQEHLSFCRDHGLKNVHFVGFRKTEALNRYYRAADLLVLPTKSDVWGLVVNEAMAQGLPVITTDKCVAGLELIRPGENGDIVPVDDNAALRDAICRLLESDLASLGANALETIRPYTIGNMALAHVEIFEKEK